MVLTNSTPKEDRFDDGLFRIFTIFMGTISGVIGFFLMYELTRYYGMLIGFSRICDFFMVLNVIFLFIPIIPVFYTTVYKQSVFMGDFFSGLNIVILALCLINILNKIK